MVLIGFVDPFLTYFIRSLVQTGELNYILGGWSPSCSNVAIPAQGPVLLPALRSVLALDWPGNLGALFFCALERAVK